MRFKMNKWDKIFEKYIDLEDVDINNISFSTNTIYCNGD